MATRRLNYMLMDVPEVRAIALVDLTPSNARLVHYRHRRLSCAPAAKPSSGAGTSDVGRRAPSDAQSLCQAIPSGLRGGGWQVSLTPTDYDYLYAAIT